MEIQIDRITQGYKERIERLALYEPLFRLEAKNMKDKAGNTIDFFGWGLLSLLFFFECMLSRRNRAGIRELGEFLFQINANNNEIDQADSHRIAGEIVRAFRPQSGKKNSRSFYNWETRQADMVQYTLLKPSGFDKENQSQFYILDEKGLELVFSTKEYFLEFHLSINQMLLRKQLETGEFIGALRQIDEMKMDVQTLRDRIIRTRHEILRNIVSEETYGRYKAIVEDINLRMQREDEEFDELQNFVRDSKIRMGHEIENEQDEKTYALLLRIDKELTTVHNEHRALFEESIELKNNALDAALDSLYHIGVSSFNFKQQLTDKLFAVPLPLAAAYRVAEPFLMLGKMRDGGTLSVFQKQRLEKSGEEIPQASFPQIVDETVAQRYAWLQRQNFTKIMLCILDALDNDISITVQQVADALVTQEHLQYLENRSFYDFWMILHHRSPLVKTGEDSDKAELSLYIMDGALDQLPPGSKGIQVQEIPGEIVQIGRYHIQNMRFEIIWGGEQSDGLS